MSRFDAIALDQLPPAAYPEALSFETIRAARLVDLAQRLTAAGVPYNADQLESDPLVILQEADAYRELLVRQRLNDAVKAVLIATAAGADLDNLVADFSLVRRTIVPADPETGAAAVMESDADLRKRRLLAVEALSTAGPEGAYIFQVLSAHGEAGDVGVYGPEADIADPDDEDEMLTGDGQVLLVVMSNIGDGEPSEELLEAVTDRVTHKDVRPLTDKVTVRPAAITSYAVEGVITVGLGPDPDAVHAAALARVTLLAESLHAVGAPITRKLFDAAATVFGANGACLVKSVALTQPPVSIAADPLVAPHCTGINLTVVVDND